MTEPPDPRRYRTGMHLAAGVVVLAACAAVFLFVAATAPSQAPVFAPAHGPSPAAGFGSPVPSATPAVPTAALTPVPTATPAVPPDFSLAVQPKEAEAAPGSSVAYTLTVQPEGGFNETITLVLDVQALFIRQQYDLGSLVPPFPRSLTYPLDVPGTLPPGITLEGTLRAEGGGIVREETILLHVV
ncbi:MAG: hypothetical protein GKC04_07640 [Methanomicrobiales archaeon]|nr:hypothetical protein [Methanomicrobiales archaeon]